MSSGVDRVILLRNQFAKVSGRQLVHLSGMVMSQGVQHELGTYDWMSGLCPGWADIQISVAED